MRYDVYKGSLKDFENSSGAKIAREVTKAGLAEIIRNCGSRGSYDSRDSIERLLEGCLAGHADAGMFVWLEGAA